MEYLSLNMRIPKQPIVTLGGADAKGYCPVRIRLAFKGRVDFYTGITVTKEQWDPESQRVRHGSKVKGISYTALNKIINERVAYIQQYLDNAVLRNDENACATELKKQYDALYMRSEQEQSDEFFYLLEEYIAKQNTLKKWSSKYKAQWDTFYSDLKKINPHITFLGLSEDFLISYIHRLAQRMSNEKILEYLKKFKEFVNYAKKRKIPINQEFYEFKPKLKKRDKECNYLTKEELKRIIQLDYSSKPRLDRVRDIFVFQCCTSLRFSDVSALTRSNVRIGKQGNLEVLLVTQKDKGKVWFPLPKKAVEIYKKYEYCHYPDNKAFHVPCGTDFRRYLAEIGEDAHIEGNTTSIMYRLNKKVECTKPRSHIGTHDARRTFIVHAINNGASFEEIALFTSHAEIKAMLPYITLTQEGKENVVHIIDNLTD